MSHAPTDMIQISRRYASAIFALALEAGRADAVIADLSALAAAIEDHAELRAALSNPTIANAQKSEILGALMKKADSLARDAVATIATGGRAAMLPTIATLLREALAEHRGEVEAVITSARPLCAATQQQLSESLARATGKKVQLTLQEDPALLGGLSIQLGSLRLDATLAGALTSMREQLLAAPAH